MKYRFFRIPVSDPDAATDELNRFLAAHAVVTADRQFIADGERSCWSFCVSWSEQQVAAPNQEKRRVDYREVLSPEDFRVFAKLRDLRKQIAAAEGAPVYALFNNEQLAEMVRKQVNSPSGLEKIEGVGASRIEKYGPQFLELLVAEQSHRASGNEQPHETDHNSN